MSLPNEINPVLLGTGAAGAVRSEIQRSLRFNSADSAYLSKNFASAGNRKTWTWAGWVKRSALGTNQHIFVADTPSGVPLSDTTFARFYINSSDYLVFARQSVNLRITNRVFRDTSAWFHIVLVLDTTEATADNRVKIYINGIELGSSDFSTLTNPSLNDDLAYNQVSVHTHGVRSREGTLAFYYDGYLADIHFIDGQALDQYSFGEFDDNGIWQPIEYTGTYPDNSFHLDFSDNSSAAALGYDAAGSNDWTVNNISVAAGAGNDSLVDVPTNGTETDTGVGGEVRGNYCTWNPVASTPNILSNGNLETTFTNASSAPFTRDTAVGSIAVSSGKYYWEVDISGTDVDKVRVGIFVNSIDYSGAPVGFRKDSSNLNNTSAKLGLALDVGAGTLKLYENNTLTYTETFTANSLCIPVIAFRVVGGGSAASICNFGQRPFAYTAPSGFKALCTANLPAPTIEDGSTAMNVVTYTGNGSTQTISGLGFSPDFVWIKNRAAADNHKLTDTVRGATEELESNTTDAEVTNDDGLTQFNSDGFDLGDDDEYNTNTETYVAWCWDAGSSNSTNTDGSITSTVRANASAGFSIVSYTGNATLEATVGHGLGAAPKIVIIKNRSVADNWIVYTSVIDGSSDFLILNLENNKSDWGITNATSTVFSLGNGTNTNGSGNDMLAYCFAPVDGFSSIGTYVGTGTADGPFVYTGFRPKWILIKCTNSGSTENWRVFDSERLGYNVNNYALYPSVGNGEGTEFLGDILSNGFKLRNPSVGTNVSGATHLYVAFAENPFALNARAR